MGHRVRRAALLWVLWVTWVPWILCAGSVQAQGLSAPAASPPPESAPSPLARDSADAPPAPGAQPIAAHMGYAFFYPPLLVRQRLFGLAHAVERLAELCAQQGEAFAADSAAAYRAWQESHAALLETLRRDLALWHFGQDSAAITPARLAQHLALPPQPQLPPDAASWPEVCASLPATLRSPRFALQRIWQMEQDMAQIARAQGIVERQSACAAHLSAAERARYHSDLATWQARNVPLQQQAQARLAAAWDAGAEAYAAWQASLRAGQPAASAAHCQAALRALSSTAHSDLEFAFSPVPPPMPHE